MLTDCHVVPHKAGTPRNDIMRARLQLQYYITADGKILKEARHGEYSI